MKKIITLGLFIILLVFMTGCSNEPTRENNYNTTMEEAEIIERILEETILEETIIH